MQVIAITNRKGGTGKTSTVISLGAGLAKKGKKILFVDMDSQANLTFALGSNAERVGCMELLTNKTTAEEAIDHTQNGDIIPASEDLATADSIIKETGKEYRLKEALEPIQKKYDYAIIDTPAALGTLTINALTAANSVIIPVQADIYSLQGIGQLNEAIEAVKRYCNPDLYINGILITRYNARAVISRDMLDNLNDAAKQLKTRLYKTPIRECIAMRESQATQQDIFTYAPRSNAALDYMELVNEFLKKGKK